MTDTQHLQMQIGLWIGGELVTSPGFSYAVGLGPDYESDVYLYDNRHPAYGWHVRIRNAVELGGGWWSVTMAVYWVDGSIIGAPRPFLIYTRPWVAPVVCPFLDVPPHWEDGKPCVVTVQAYGGRIGPLDADQAAAERESMEPGPVGEGARGLKVEFSPVGMP